MGKILLGLILFLSLTFVSAWNFESGGGDVSLTTLSGNLTNLSQMGDVDTTGVLDGEALVYESSTGKWEPLTIAGISDTNCSGAGSCSNIVYFANTSSWDKTVANDFTNISNFTGAKTNGGICYYNSSTDLLNCSYVDVSGGSETTWIANYSTFLTHIDWSKVVNGTVLLTSQWNSNYTANNDAWLNTTNSTYHAYNLTGLIRDWNSTGLIKDWNSTGYIKNWSVEILATSGISWANVVNGTVLLSADEGNLDVNSSNYWDNYNSVNTTQFENQAGVLHIVQSWFTTLWDSIFATKTTDNLAQGSINFYDNRSWNHTAYYNNASATFVLQGTFTDTNETVRFEALVTTDCSAGSLVIGIQSNGTVLCAVDSALNTSYYLATNPFSFYNVTTAPIYLNDTFRGSNYSTFLTHMTWANAVNGTLATWVNAYNGTLAKTDANNVFGNYNQTFNSTTFFLNANRGFIGIGTITPQNALNVIGDSNSTGSIYAQRTKNLSVGYDYATNGTFVAWSHVTNGTMASWVQAMNGTLAKWSEVMNSTLYQQTVANSTFLKLSGGNMTGNINMSTNNITFSNGTNGGRVCLSQNCITYILHNGTGVVIQG